MLGLGLKVTNSDRTAFDMKGYFFDTSTYWTHDIAGSSTSLDSLANVTVLINCSYAAVKPIYTGYNIPTLLHAIADQTNDTGFQISPENLSKHNPTYGAGQTNNKVIMADGSGVGTTLATNAEKVSRWGYNTNGDIKKQEGCPHFCYVVRFKSGATNEMQSMVISNNAIQYTEGNNDVADLGEISGKTNIQIGNNNNFGGYNSAAFTQGTILMHKVAIWNTALADADIMKLTGFNHTSVATTARADLDGYYHDAVRFKNYSDLSVDEPEHLWDFSKKTPASYSGGTTSDTGGTGGLTMTAIGTPVISSRGMK